MQPTQIQKKSLTQTAPTSNKGIEDRTSTSRSTNSIPNSTKNSNNNFSTDAELSHVIPATRAESLYLPMTDERNVARYRNEVDGVFDGSLPTGQDILIGMPSKVLTDNHVSNRALHISQNVVRKAAMPDGYQKGKHNLGISALKNLIFQLNDPVAITENTMEQRAKSENKSVVIWTEWVSSANNPIIAAVTIDS